MTEPDHAPSREICWNTSEPVRDGESGQGGAGAPPPSALYQTKPPAGEEAVKQL